MSDLLKFETSLKRKKPVKDKTDTSSVLKSFKLDFNPLNFLYSWCRCSGMTGCFFLPTWAQIRFIGSNKFCAKFD